MWGPAAPPPPPPPKAPASHPVVKAPAAEPANPWRAGRAKDVTKAKHSKRVRVVCLSDTHNKHLRRPIPEGDILIYAGDFSENGEQHEIALFNEFLSKLPHKHKLVISGNHETSWRGLRPADIQKQLPHCTYVQDQLVEVEGLKIYGSPCCDCGPFGVHHDGNTMKGVWKQIPRHLDILVTHIPPRGVADLALDPGKPVATCTVCGETHPNHQHWGSATLLERGMSNLSPSVKDVTPRVHVYGHVHDGAPRMTFLDGCPTMFLNVAQDLFPKPIYFNIEV